MPFGRVYQPSSSSASTVKRDIFAGKSWGNRGRGRIACPAVPPRRPGRLRVALAASPASLRYRPAKAGAGDGNRTHVASLEGWSSTIELHPLSDVGNRTGPNVTPHLIPPLPISGFRFPISPPARGAGGGGGWTRTNEGIASGFTVRPLCRSGHSPISGRKTGRGGGYRAIGGGCQPKIGCSAVYIAPVSDCQHQHDNPVILQAADQPDVSDAIAPQRALQSDQRLAELSGIRRLRDARLKKISDASAIFCSQLF